MMAPKARPSRESCSSIASTHQLHLFVVCEADVSLVNAFDQRSLGTVMRTGKYCSTPIAVPQEVKMLLYICPVW